MPKYRLDEIAINSTEKKKPIEADKDTYIGLEHLDSGCLEVTHWGADVAPIGDKLVMRKGDVLFGRRRAYQKKVAIAPFDGIFSAHGMVLRPIESVISKEFFPFFISSDYFLDAAIKISVGSLSPTINWRDLAKLEFQIPSLEEQEAISSILWAMNRLKVAYTNLLQQADALVQSQFVEMFGELGTDNHGWGLTTLGKCCVLNPTRPRGISPDLQVSFVAMPSVTEKGEIDSSIVKPYSEASKGFTYFEERDVLFAKITPCMENGKGCVATGLTNGIGGGSTEFHVLRPISGVSNPYWLYCISIMPKFRKNARKVMTGTGGQLRVPISFIDSQPITLPPIDLQDQFEEFYHETDKSKLAIRQALESLEKSRSAIMTKVFG